MPPNDPNQVRWDAAQLAERLAALQRPLPLRNNPVAPPQARGDEQRVRFNHRVWPDLDPQGAEVAPAAAPRGVAMEMDWLINPEVQTLETFTPKLNKKDMDTATVADLFGHRVPSAIQKVINSHLGQNIFGVELELENFPVGLEDAEAVGFNFTTDGSLRNRGVEAVSKPNNKTGILAVTKALWERFQIDENNFSDRTSIHVHANVLHFTQDNLRTLALTYQVFEDLLFTFVGNDRFDNIFCVPWCEAGVTYKTFERVLRKAKEWLKYTALNLAPVATQGTVEFRHMHGHANYEMFEAWLTLIDELLTYATKNKVDDVVQIISNLNTNSEYGKFIQSVFPEGHKHIMIGNWENRMSRGVIEAKLMLL